VFTERTDSAALSATGQPYECRLWCGGWAPSVIVSGSGSGTDGQRRCQRLCQSVLAMSSTPRNPGSVAVGALGPDPLAEGTDDGFLAFFAEVDSRLVELGVHADAVMSGCC
jgi:hypothetical protein